MASELTKGLELLKSALDGNYLMGDRHKLLLDQCIELSKQSVSQEVIAAGDAMHKRLGSDIDFLTLSAKAEAIAEREAWNAAKSTKS